MGKIDKTDGHYIYPYLLRGLTIDCPYRVWAMDITYPFKG
jgi:putative transposase